MKPGAYGLRLTAGPARFRGEKREAAQGEKYWLTNPEFLL